MTEPLHVLLIDDLPEDRVLTAKALNKHYPNIEVHQVFGRDDYALAQHREYELIISDAKLGWIDGMELSHQTHTRWPDSPHILLVDRELTAGQISEIQERFNGSLIRSSKNGKQLEATIAVAMDRARRRRMVQRVSRPYSHDSTYVRLLQEVAVTANESESIEDAILVCLDRVCAHTAWPMGHARLLIDATGMLQSTGLWHVDEANAERFSVFREITESRAIIAPNGLAGRVLATKKPAWISDVTKDPNFLRAKLANDIGVKAAFAFPVLVRSEIVAVLEFFSDQILSPDEHLLDVMAHVGTQLGRVVERKRARDRLNYLAHHDTLTGLPNRALFVERLQTAIKQTDQNELLLGVIFIDLDHFKTINDTLGHDAGDLLIQSVAERLTSCVRVGDTVARMSGDEFTLLLSNISHVDDATRIAQKILNLFSSPFLIAERELFVSASVGITVYPFDDRDVEGLLRNADIAMYRAKEMGRNNYQFYTAELTTRAHQRLTLAGDLHRAVKNNEFVNYYQPIIDIATGRIIAAEALVRWQHPDWGLTEPGRFIPMAEETGLIISIGGAVLSEACRQAVRWHSAGFQDLRMMVNLSARQFEEKKLIADISQALDESRLNAKYLELEITESALMKNTDTALAVLREVAALGVQLSLDDFGTGYSALSYLKRFPIDTLKIDQSFIRDIPGDADDAAIASAILAMAAALEIKVIAEGVETKEQLDYLRMRHCDAVQGYYFCRPVPADRFLELLRGAQPVIRR